MRITLKLYAMLSDCLPDEARKTNSVALDIGPGMTVAQLIGAHNLPPRLCHLVLIDGVFIPPEQRAQRALVDGETLAIWPPVAGG